MTAARAIIACAGPQPKWGNHLGVPKQLAPIDGVPLLHRTVAAVRQHTDDIIVTAPPGDARFQVAGAATVEPHPGLNSNEYVGCQPWWNPAGRTVLLLGDVYFTDAALTAIMGCPDRDYRVFGRYGPSRLTGTPYGEIFAVSWWTEQHRTLCLHLARVAATPHITRPPGWKLLRSWQGTPMNRHRVHRPPFVDVDDLTDDLDSPADYERHPVFRAAQ